MGALMKLMIVETFDLKAILAYENFRPVKAIRQGGMWKVFLI